MNIVYLTTEAVPFAKTGGLADVCGALPSRVAAKGHRCAIVMPAFRSIRQCGLPIETTDISFALPMGPKSLVGGRLLKSQLPGSGIAGADVPVWFIDQPKYFDRESLYGTAAGDYPDNAERFAFFCRAALAALSRIGWSLDVVHCNDWQTGLVPALMRAGQGSAGHEPMPWTSRTATVFTIHNLAYQGSFDADAYPFTGLDWAQFQPESFEFFGRLNFMKAGIVTADAVTTVSPRYAKEIRTPEHGRGLDEVLRGIDDRVSGIINGIDGRVWEPTTDPMIPHNYGVDDWAEGKWQNKWSLQQQFGLFEDRDLPLIGLVGRLADQKGWDLILPVLKQHLAEDRPTQWIVLGSGDPAIEVELQRLHAAYSGRFALHIGFSNELAHRIEAGSDLFLMPSHYEPCGLNQLYSLRYGTVPIVTPTGGLADTVVDASEEALGDGTATGFHVDAFEPWALDQAIGRALHMRYHEPENWKNIVETGMKQDWSWRKSADRYVELYERLISLNRKGQ
ncbi:glycogen synthase GlgA [Crateriforma conspicua]|uniref:Glycogen synthase n=1 Tax=Crateriforma conspicua TaxID=2527996 RepID=A0A5C5XRH6_9PLAN|nr:glycogen synthase GlgA [Crateriforma conspicua]TWT65826.1 Glycogen synthase [Crateriforma conspicua]